MDEIILNVKRNSTNKGVAVNPNLKIFDLDYVDDAVYPFESSAEAGDSFSSFKTSTERFGMRFAPIQYQLMTQDWTETSPTLTTGDNRLKVIDHFIYLGGSLTQNET